MRIPEAVNSDPTVTTQFTQYMIPTINPVDGPINVVAYV